MESFKEGGNPEARPRLIPLTDSIGFGHLPCYRFVPFPFWREKKCPMSFLVALGHVTSERSAQKLHSAKRNVELCRNQLGDKDTVTTATLNRQERKTTGESLRQKIRNRFCRSFRHSKPAKRLTKPSCCVAVCVSQRQVSSEILLFRQDTSDTSWLLSLTRGLSWLRKAPLFFLCEVLWCRVPVVP